VWWASLMMYIKMKYSLQWVCLAHLAWASSETSRVDRARKPWQRSPHLPCRVVMISLYYIYLVIFNVLFSIPVQDDIQSAYYDYQSIIFESVSRLTQGATNSVIYNRQCYDMWTHLRGRWVFHKSLLYNWPWSVLENIRRYRFL